MKPILAPLYALTGLVAGAAPWWDLYRLELFVFWGEPPEDIQWRVATATVGGGLLMVAGGACLGPEKLGVILAVPGCLLPWWCYSLVLRSWENLEGVGIVLLAPCICSSSRPRS